MEKGIIIESNLILPIIFFYFNLTYNRIIESNLADYFFYSNLTYLNLT